jgi:predicted flap endonuclease-1-like 5' DNA nuclease
MSPPILISFLLLGMYILKRARSDHAVWPAQQGTPAVQELDDGAPAAAPDLSIGDVLTRIWGIGTSAAAQLRAAGFVTFSQLATLDEAQLVELLGSQWMKMETWPEQARLAAAGDWQALDALQNEL